jgi:hypothetical protein
MKTWLSMMMQICVFFMLLFTSHAFSSSNPTKTTLSSAHRKYDRSESHLMRNLRVMKMFHSSKDSTSMNTAIPLNKPFPTSIIAQATTIPNAEVVKTSSLSRNVDTSNYELSPQQFIYVILTSIFITCLIVADVVGVKLFEIPLPFEILGHKTVEHTCGMLTFPITFILGDIINEYYGPKAAKNTVREEKEGIPSRF